MIETSKALRVVNRKSHQAYLSGLSWLTNHLLLKWKTFGLFQKTRYHSNKFSLNRSRQNYCNHKTLYLGGSHEEDESIYLLVSNAQKESQKEPLLRRTHEETDDRIMFHLSQFITDAEIFLVKCVSSNCSIEFFD